MGVDPSARKPQRGLLIVPVGQPRVWPQMDAGEVDVWGRMVAQEIAADRERIEWVVWQKLCTKHLSS